MSVSQAQIDLLKQFVQICKLNPSILCLPQLNFYREWIESLGGKIPDVAETKPSGSFESGDAAFNAKSTDHDEESRMDDTPAPEEAKEEETKEDETKEDETKEAETEESESGTESEMELDNEGVIEGDSDPPLEMGDSSLAVTEEMCDQSSEKRREAMDAANEDRLSDSIDLYTQAIQLNPQSAALFAKRASVLIRMQKPNAAITDCDHAIQLNPDSAQGYKCRGKARRLIGDWLGAYNDLNTANRMDYDDSVVELLHQVEANAKRILEHRRRYEREHDERELKNRKERLRKAREQHEKAKRASESEGSTGAFPGGMPGGFPGGMPGGFPGGMPGGFPGGMPGGMPGGGSMPDITSLLSDPELMAAFQDPEVLAAFDDVSKHPANISKYEKNPKIKSVIEKMSKKFGGAGTGSAPDPCGGGAEGSCGGSCA